MHRIAAETLPAAFYRDAALYQTERRRIFAQSWHLVAHESQCAEPGDWLALTIAAYPVFLLRGEDGLLRAFHNVCRHRAGALVEDGAGRCEQRLVCRYHGWRYALDGRLASARDFGPADDFDTREYALFPLACESWRGLVYVNVDVDAAPLAEAIAPLVERAREMPLESFHPAQRMSHDIRCNWKTYVENYLEGYHVPVVHPALYATIDSSRYEIELRGDIVFHSAPPRDCAAVAGLWGWMWPCLGINVYAHGLMLERVWPLDHARTRLDYLWLFAPDLPENEREAAIAASEATTAEDIAITEAVQKNLDAGVYDRGRLSPKHEDAVALFQRRYAGVMEL